MLRSAQHDRRQVITRIWYETAVAGDSAARISNIYAIYAAGLRTERAGETLFLGAEGAGSAREGLWRMSATSSTL
jgi:hypothetical protein